MKLASFLRFGYSVLGTVNFFLKSRMGYAPMMASFGIRLIGELVKLYFWVCL